MLVCVSGFTYIRELEFPLSSSCYLVCASCVGMGARRSRPVYVYMYTSRMFRITDLRARVCLCASARLRVSVCAFVRARI